MVWISWKTKVKFVSEIPLSVALFCMTQPADSASLSWASAFLRTGASPDAQRAKRRWAWEYTSYEINVRGAATCRWATMLPHPVAGLSRARCLQCLRRELLLASKILQLPSLSRTACLSQQPMFHGRGGGEGIQLRAMAMGAVTVCPALGKAVQGTIRHRDLACLLFGCVDRPSICSLWRWRGRVP